MSFFEKNIPQVDQDTIMEAEETLTVIVTHVASFFIIFGGIVPYIPQYLDIRKTKNAEGFSLFVCFVLLVANILRILFWFGRHFETPLLLQSIIMIATMFAMIHLCTTVKMKGELVASKPKVFSDFDSRHFWHWSDFSSYVEFMCLFSAATGALTYFLLDVSWYVETIGFLAVFFEAMLGAPQFIKNYQNRSTKGMSIKMVLMWTSGDIFKTVYFILRAAPVQFWVCGMLQVSLDIAILFQVFYYGYRKPSVQ